MTINYTDTELKQEIAKSLGDTALAYTTFSEALIEQVVKECLREFSRYYPYLVRESLLTTADTKEVDIGTLDDVLHIDYAEYYVNKNPKQLRNVINRRNGFITLDIDWLPSGADAVYLYCKKLQSAATLQEAHLELFARLGAARCLITASNTELIQAKADMTTGRALINTVNKGGSGTSVPSAYVGYARAEEALARERRTMGERKLMEVLRDIRMAGAKPNHRIGFSSGGVTDTSESYLKVGD